MKLGQTSLTVFLSKLLGSALGFVATFYLARELGAEVLGLYSLLMTVVVWLILVADLGISGAATKRISEGTEQGEFLAAAAVWILGLSIAVSIAAILGRSILESYITEFDQYVSISVVWFVVLFIFIRAWNMVVIRVLNGERRVHLAGLLNPIKIGTRSLVQIGLVFAGWGLLGMLVGFVVGTVLASLVGLLWVTTRPARPSRRHFQSLFDYAKFGWLSRLQGRTYNEVDILLLGAFVPASLVGVYSVAWSLSTFLDLFGTAIRSTMFPELSYTSTQESDQEAAELVEDALAYTGLIAIPGLVGGVILGDRLLQLYGPEFTEGTAVLGLLILAVLLFSYQKQLMNGLNGLDRPDLAFRVNVVFVVLNTGLNLLLIWQFGIEGAAVATALSVAVTLVLAYYSLSRLITFELPVAQIARQCAAAMAMGAVVLTTRGFVESFGIVDRNATLVVSLVGLGAGVYFLTLLTISQEFRATVGRNLPIEVPFLG